MKIRLGRDSGLLLRRRSLALLDRGEKKAIQEGRKEKRLEAGVHSGQTAHWFLEKLPTTRGCASFPPSFLPPFFRLTFSPFRPCIRYFRSVFFFVSLPCLKAKRNSFCLPSFYHPETRNLVIDRSPVFSNDSYEIYLSFPILSLELRRSEKRRAGELFQFRQRRGRSENYKNVAIVTSLRKIVTSIEYARARTREFRFPRSMKIRLSPGGENVEKRN